MSEPAIKKAITVLDMLSRDPETVRLAELRMKKILDEKSLLEGAREEAREQGLKEGLRSTAKNLLVMGMDKETVAKATNLDMEEIEKIQLEINH